MIYVILAGVAIVLVVAARRGFALSTPSTPGPAATPGPSPDPMPTPKPMLTSIQQLVHNAAIRHGVRPAVALAIVQTESNFNPEAINPSDPSYGLGQIQPFWLKFLGIGQSIDARKLLLDPSTNANATARIIKYFEGKGFAFPAQADVYNVGETKYNAGVRNAAYRVRIETRTIEWEAKL